MNNSFGNRLKITIFGASHAAEVGVLVEGVPAGVVLPIEAFMTDIDRRRPSRCGETPRHEADVPRIEGLDADGLTMGVCCVLALRIVIYAVVTTTICDVSHAPRMPTWCSCASMARSVTLLAEVWLRVA